MNQAFEAVYNNSSDAILLIEGNRFIDCNSSALKMLLAEDKESILNIEPSKLSPTYQPDGRESYTKAKEMIDICKKDGTHRFKWMHRRLNGEDFLAEVVLTTIFLKNKEVIHVAWRDITLENKRNNFIKIYRNLLLEQAESPSYSLKNVLQKAAEISTKALDIERAGIWLFNAENNSLNCYNNYERSTDKHSNGIRLVEKKYPNYFKELLKAKPLIIIDVHSDFRLNELENDFLEPYNLSSIMDIPIFQKGEMVGVVCFGSVNQIRKWSEEEKEFALSISDMVSHSLTMSRNEKTQEKIKQIGEVLENSQTIVVYWKAEEEWPVEYISKNISMLGYTDEDFYLSKITYNDLIHKDDMDRVFEEVLKYSKSGVKNFMQVYRLIDAYGNIVWIDDRTTVQRDSNGKILYYFGTIIDITKQKESEFLAQQAFEDKIKQSQLLAQQSKLASMGDMISNIAHQWRQPLNTLSLVIQKLERYDRKGKLNSEILYENVATGMGIIKNMSLTIDDFRNFFQPNKEKSFFNLLDSINEVNNLMKSTLYDNHIQLDIDINDELLIYGYKNEFLQVLLNIISNARYACLEQKVKNAHIVISALKVNDKIAISISNNGGNIAKEHIMKIFEPYYTTKEEGKGTGIGLYMSKVIIEEHMGGKLEVENIENGVKFNLFLPSK